jgi:sec-independent protein translocase protein TatA
MLPFQFGLPELLIVLVIIILIFGVGRISKVAGELGKGIREFRKGLSGAEDKDTEEPTNSKEE